jgi:hypothetical protein
LDVKSLSDVAAQVDGNTVAVDSGNYRGWISMDSRNDSTDSSATDAAEQATTTGQSDEDADEIGGFIFNNSLNSDGANPEHETEQLAKQERIVDLVRLQPTKNAELQDQWGLDTGSDVHQYLESQFKDYYYRDDDGYIRATDAAEEFVQNHQDVYQDVTEPDNEPEEAPNLQHRDLVIALVTLTQELGHLPSADEINEYGEYRHQRYREEFGDLFSAYQVAGILPDDVTRTDFYGEESAEPGGSEAASTAEPEDSAEPETEFTSTEEEATENAKPREPVEEDEGEQELVEIDASAVDVDRPSFDAPEGIEESNLVREIQRFADLIDEPPTEELVVAYGRYPSDTYRAAFGSWNAVLETAGYDPGDIPDWSNRSHTNTDILDGLRAVADKLGRAPTTTETGKHVDFSPGLASLRFGSWSDALKAAGLDPLERSSVQGSDSGEREDETADDGETEDDNGGSNEEDDPIGSVIDDTLENMLLSDDEDGGPL